MDGPIDDYSDERKRKVDKDDDAEHVKKVEYALEEDNKDDFVKWINTMPCEELEFELAAIRSFAFLSDSADCVAAVLAGEVKISNAVALLSEPDGDVLPLNVMLSKFRRKLLTLNSKAGTSAITLIVELFRKWKDCLEVLRLVALNTKEIKHEFFKYLKEGKMFEVGTLLLVARSRLLSPSTTKEESDLGFQSISEMHDFLLDAKTSLSIGSNPSESHLKDKLTEIDETLQLLKIFDSVGDKLSTLIRLNFYQIGFNFRPTAAAALLIEDAGFDVTPEHIGRPRLSTSIVRFQSNIFERVVADCKKTALATHMLPSLLKENALRGGNNFRLTNSSSRSLAEMNRISSPFHRLLKHSYPFLGILKMASRRG